MANANAKETQMAKAWAVYVGTTDDWQNGEAEVFLNGTWHKDVAEGIARQLRQMHPELEVVVEKASY